MSAVAPVAKSCAHETKRALRKPSTLLASRDDMLRVGGMRSQCGLDRLDTAEALSLTTR